jgi:hypothetical protein
MVVRLLALWALYPRMILGSLQGSMALKIPNFLNWLTDDGENVSPLHFTLKGESWHSFLLEAESMPRSQYTWKD